MKEVDQIIESLLKNPIEKGKNRIINGNIEVRPSTPYATNVWTIRSDGTKNGYGIDVLRSERPGNIVTLCLRKPNTPFFEGTFYEAFKTDYSKIEI